MKEDGNVMTVHLIVTSLPKNNVLNVKFHDQKMLNFSFLNNNKKKMDRNNNNNKIKK